MPCAHCSDGPGEAAEYHGIFAEINARPGAHSNFPTVV
jgi:hypothetical protein